jgi:hypothetical protein
MAGRARSHGSGSLPAAEVNAVFMAAAGGSRGGRAGFCGYASDIERADVLYTSLLVQMQLGLAAADVPSWSRSPRAWRRSWLLGFATAVVSRVRAAEQDAAAQATAPAAASGSRRRWCSPTVGKSSSAPSSRRIRSPARSG